MGYTHYFNFKKDIGNFSNEVLKDIKKIIDDYKDIIQLEHDNSEKPLATINEIRFNGVGHDGYETFYLSSNTTDFNFCKTARNLYDLPVCEILLILKHHYKNDFKLESDGFNVSEEDFKLKKLDSNWNQALENVKNEFGYTFNLIPEIHNGYYSFSIE